MDAADRVRPRMSVLLVEDDEDQRYLMERRLQDEGIFVRSATTGREALELASDVDLVLLDFRLPDMTGLETLEAMREVTGPSVVMMTAAGSEEVAVSAMRAGAIDYVVKDANFIRMLPDVVERAWRHHDLARRASKLQDLAFIVGQAENREDVFAEIVNGAQQLLSAAVCALALLEDEGLQIVASTNPDVEYVPWVLEKAEEVVAAGETSVSDFVLIVPLAKQGEELLGVLMIISSEERLHAPQEVQLAETFAAFGGVALSRLRRQELERSLTAELQQTLEMRKDFVNSISHELRTPLACISGFSTTLINYWGRLDEKTTYASVEKIQQHAEDLSSLVDALLDFGDVERGSFVSQPEAFELRPDIEKLVGDMQPVLGERAVEIDVPDVTVRADRTLVKRVLMNLLSNSVKATEPKSVIRVKASTPNGMARVEVVDEGLGLTPEEQARVFEPFWRSPKAIRQAKRGAGIGLTLVREYVRTMGGQVGVQSELGKGATFYFTLPLVDEHV